jgi:hypothetical protein
VFNANSHLQGIIHYDPTLKNVHQRILEEWNLDDLEASFQTDGTPEDDAHEDEYDEDIEEDFIEDTLDEDIDEEMIVFKRDDE